MKPVYQAPDGSIYDTKARQVYQAVDGSIFDVVQDCIHHERMLANKGEVVVDWLISGVTEEIATINSSNPVRAQSLAESAEMLKLLVSIKDTSGANRLSEFAREACLMVCDWQSEPENLEAVRLVLSLIDSLGNVSLSSLEKVFALIHMTYMRTEIINGEPAFPSTSENDIGSKFSDKLYFYSEDLHPVISRTLAAD